MADVTLTHQRATRSGLEEVYSTSSTDPALSTTDRFLIENNGKLLLRVATGDTATTVTIEIPQTVDGQSVTSRSVAVPANSHRTIGHFPTSIYNNADSQIAITLSAVTNVELAAVCLP